MRLGAHGASCIAVSNEARVYLGAEGYAFERAGATSPLGGGCAHLDGRDRHMSPGRLNNAIAVHLCAGATGYSGRECTGVIDDKEKYKTDAEIQKVIQPELDRQHKAGVARRLVYDRGGGVLIISGALLMLWFSWLRPKHGAGAGVPGYFLSILERPPDARKKV